MSDYKMPDTLAAFYAHALGLEHECECWLIDLSRSLQAHHNPEAAAIFVDAEKLCVENIEQIHQRSVNLELPRVAPWEYYWHQFVNIENTCIDSVHYMISALEAIELVLEKLAADSEYYHAIEQQSDDLQIKQAARQIISLLDSEMELVRGWKSQQSKDVPLTDLDPPNMPE